MTQESDKPINLAVHETADPSEISRNPNQEASADLNDSVHDDENVDTPNPRLFDNADDENLTDNPITIANLSAG